MSSGAEWWRGAVIYQVYPRSFADANGDGVGDLAGLVSRVPHIASLGVDAIWLCPVWVSPQRDFGYDVADHMAVDPLFGTQADFDLLIETAHVHGLRVLVDLVMGHTSDRHPWFLDSRLGRGGMHDDWYVWADPSPDGTPPNNWLSVFGGSAWTWEPRRRQYYLHHFLASQPTLNLRNPAVADALLDVAEFWLKRGVDGFRVDAVDFFTHDPALRSNPANPPADGITPAKLFGLQRHDHDMMQPATFGLLRRLRALCDRYPGTATLGEVSSQPGAFERVMRYSAGDDLLHMAYTLRPLRGGFDHPTVRGLIEDAALVNGAGWACWSFSNHDVERAVSRWCPSRTLGGAPDPRFARLLMTLLMSLRGSVCLFQGEELGLPEAELRLEEIRDPFGIAYWPEFRGRDGSRTPMPWQSAAAHAGFTSAPQPWLPLPESHRALAVDAQERDPESLLHFTRRLLALRRAHPALVRGTLQPLGLPEPLVGFVRESTGAEGATDRVVCLFNLSAEPVETGLKGLEPLPGVTTSSVSVLPPWGTLFARPVSASLQRPEPAFTG